MLYAGGTFPTAEAKVMKKHDSTHINHIDFVRTGSNSSTGRIFDQIDHLLSSRSAVLSLRLQNYCVDVPKYGTV